MSTISEQADQLIAAWTSHVEATARQVSDVFRGMRGLPPITDEEIAQGERAYRRQVHIEHMAPLHRLRRRSIGVDR